ncbi:Na+/H+ antiporter NhaA [Szabonella alba]|uniref:Putative Na(+)/H(+) antiporter NhaA homolog n=1 Tax=Szabonella alba TaxID=2804194 RepID=A0A8K0VDG4_9RHOB|nr:Na+/H+ antiporter NhaA [Szabonella alba]MBL4917110.1 Na+/H+ antiporter NhaA [Szabonella alba]
MTPVSPVLRRYGLVLISGAGLAALCVGLAPATYYDLVEWPLSDLGRRLFAPGVTPATLISGLLMPFFLLLIGKELWESLRLDRGLAARGRLPGPLLVALGGMAGGALVWTLASALLQTAEEAAGTPGWVFPLAGDTILAFLFGCMILGRGHPALQILLFVTIFADVTALVMAGLFAPALQGLEVSRFLWLILPLAAACLAHVLLTRPAQRPDASEVTRQRAQHLWLWALPGIVSWFGVAMAGFPPALGLLPLLPAMPHSDRSFGLFAEAEGFLTDPLNRLSHLLMTPLLLVLALFAFTHGAILPGLLSEPTTAITLLAFWIGKPAGVMAAILLCRGLGLRLDLAPGWREPALIAGLAGIGFTVPLLMLHGSLPGGMMQEAARLGLALSVLAGPVLWVAARRSGIRPVRTGSAIRR